jgi:hypothetical protein
MLEYRLCRFGPDHRVFTQIQFQAEDDFAAMEAACVLYEAIVMPRHGFEIWQGLRRARTEDVPAMPTRAPN